MMTVDSGFISNQKQKSTFAELVDAKAHALSSTFKVEA
jgi:hypothetical protein